VFWFLRETIENGLSLSNNPVYATYLNLHAEKRRGGVAVVVAASARPPNKQNRAAAALRRPRTIFRTADRQRPADAILQHAVLASTMPAAAVRKVRRRVCQRTARAVDDSLRHRAEPVTGQKLSARRAGGGCRTRRTKRQPADRSWQTCLPWSTLGRSPVFGVNCRGQVVLDDQYIRCRYAWHRGDSIENVTLTRSKKVPGQPARAQTLGGTAEIDAPFGLASHSRRRLSEPPFARSTPHRHRAHDQVLQQRSNPSRWKWYRAAWPQSRTPMPTSG
jgi:hypothetical protein